MHIIHQHGDAKSADLGNGKTANREEQLLVPEWGAFVKCAPYDDHFIYASNEPGGSAYQCTCGSVAVVVPPGPAGMFVCLFHATYGAHQTSFVNRNDFNELAGQTLEINPDSARWI